MKFAYKATKKDGTTYQDVREVSDKFELFRQLRKEGDVVISCSEVKAGAVSMFQAPDFLQGVSVHEKIIFARNLGGMIEAGLAISRALQVLEHQASKKKLKLIFNHLNTSISQGKTFHQALGEFPKIFNSLFISMVKAGEESGNLASSLKQVGDQMEKSYLIQKKVKGAMIYPAIIMSLMLVIGVLLLTFVVPRLTKTFSDLKTDLPASTKFIIWLSDTFQHHYLLIALVAFITVGFFYYALRTKEGKHIFEYTVLRLPVVGLIVRESNSASTTRTLSSLLSSGVDLVLALQITSEVLQNSFYKKVLNEAVVRVEKGRPLSEVFMENEFLYPTFVGEMASVGEETGELSHMLAGVATFYEEEVDQKTKDMSTIVEPVMMIIVGAVVGFFALSMITPMYSVLNNL